MMQELLLLLELIYLFQGLHSIDAKNHVLLRKEPKERITFIAGDEEPNDDRTEGRSRHRITVALFAHGGICVP